MHFYTPYIHSYTWIWGLSSFKPQLLLTCLMLWVRITVKTRWTGPLSSTGSQQPWTLVVTVSHTQWPVVVTSLWILTTPQPLPLLCCLRSTRTTLSVLMLSMSVEQPLVHRGVPRPLWGLRQNVSTLHCCMSTVITSKCMYVYNYPTVVTSKCMYNY